MARKIFNGLDLQNQRIQQVGSPSSPTDAVNKAYVDARVQGLVWKQAVRAASTTDITISSPGSVIDGVTLTNGDRVLLKDQSTQSQNGIYVFNGAAVAMTRASDADSSDTLVPNTTVFVSEGTVNADTAWTLTTDAPITVGTTSLAWAQINGGGGGPTYTAGDGLELDGTEFNVKPGTGITVSGGDVAIDTSVVARKYSTAIGNGSSTAIAVNHNLGTRNVVVSVHDAATYEEVYPDITKTDANTVTVTFAVAPAASAYVVTVIG